MIRVINISSNTNYLYMFHNILFCTRTTCINNNYCPNNTDNQQEQNNEWNTICFQRGSYKDEIFVYIFMILTFGLLMFAICKPFITKYIQVIQD